MTAVEPHLIISTQTFSMPSLIERSINKSMPKLGIKPIREQQLIEATMRSIAAHGLAHSTIITISKEAGLSSGIISHYFGGKQGLIIATVKQLLEQLRLSLLSQVTERALSPAERLMAIVDANFTDFQQSLPVTKTWLSFWAQAMHDPALARLQRINSERLYRNLRYSYRQLMPREQATRAAKQTAALIDGCWLRSTLSETPDQTFREASTLCKSFIDEQLTHYGSTTCQ